MATYSNTQKVCATCEFWTGEREVQSSRTSVKAEEKEKYKCVETKSNDKRAGYSCNKYEKLAVLK